MRAGRGGASCNDFGVARARRCFQDVAIADGFSEMEMEMEMEIPRWGLGLLLHHFSFHAAAAAVQRDNCCCSLASLV